MIEETREEKIRRLIEKHIRDRNMDPKSITEHYSKNDFGIELDPDYYEMSLKVGWGFFKDEPRYLDHMTRQILISVFLAFRGTIGCYHQGKKGVMMGASYEQMLEAYEVGRIVGGGPVLVHGLAGLKRMADEGVKPGSQLGPWTGKWVQLGPSTPVAKKEGKDEKEVDSGAREERILRLIQKYQPDEEGDLNKDLAYGVNLDPDFFEPYAQFAWEFFGDKPRYLDPIRREMIMLMILAFQGRREEVYSHTKKAMKLGATAEQLLEAFQVVGGGGGGSRVLMEGLRALRRIHEERQGKPKMRKRDRKE